MPNFVQSFGVVQSSFAKGNKKSQRAVKWVGNYDGNMADVQIAVNDNGNQENVRIKMDNEDIINLLNIPSNNVALEQRLITDFPSEKKSKKARKNKSTKKNKKNKTKKNKKCKK